MLLGEPTAQVLCAKKDYNGCEALSFSSQLCLGLSNFLSAQRGEAVDF